MDLPRARPRRGLLAGAGRRPALRRARLASACSTSPCGSRPTPSARCTSTTGCAPRRDADEAHCAALCARLGVALDVERPRRPEAPATCRPGRATCATARAPRCRRRGARSPPATRPTDQAETILYRLASSPGRRALLGMAARDGPARAAAARRHARGDRGALPRARPGVARGRDERGDAYARGRVRAGSCRRCEAVHPAARAQRRAHGRAAARRGRGARRGRRRRRSPAATDDRRSTHLRRAAAARSRGSCVRRLAEDAVGRLVPGASARPLDEILALADDGDARPRRRGARRCVDRRVAAAALDAPRRPAASDARGHGDRTRPPRRTAGGRSSCRPDPTGSPRRRVAPRSPRRRRPPPRAARTGASLGEHSART